jgi:signal transduction histidine kinase
MMGLNVECGGIIADQNTQNKLEEFDLIYQNMKEGVVFNEIHYNESGKADDYIITKVNLQFAKMFNLEPENIIGRFAVEVFGIAIPPYFNLCIKIAETGGSIEIETYYSKVEKYFAVLIFSNKKKYFTAVFNDITEKKKLEADLQKAVDKAEELSKLKFSILSNMNHEFRTPMTGILGMAAILKEKICEPENSILLNYITTSGQRLMKTLNAILELAENESNIKNLELIELSKAADNAINEYKEKAVAKGLQFNCDIKEKSLGVVSNEKIISEIFSHLLDNAVKFTEQGYVDVIICDDEHDDKYWAKIIVKDTGIGIAPESQDLVFHEFRQVSEGISRSFEGVGLGLTLVKKLIGIMKGKLVLESEFGKGSQFTVYLPAVKMANGKPIEPIKVTIIKKEGRAHNAQHPSVLLVEDNLINIKVTEVYLKNICNVEYAKNGLQALKMAGEKKYSMVLMDINLGSGIDGIKATKLIREIKGYEKTPIIALTGYVMESDKDALYSEGLTGHLAKPFDKTELIELVESVLAEK